MTAHVCTLPICWGWGCSVTKMEKGWKCPGCGSKHAYANTRPDGLTICGDCARALHLEEVA